EKLGSVCCRPLVASECESRTEQKAYKSCSPLCSCPSIPVKLGIDYVAQTQLIHWSNQHALCSLECALLLAKWLQEVTTGEPNPPLTASEHRVLEYVVQLVAETEYKVSCKQILQEKTRSSSMTVRLWAKPYQSSSVWETVNLIGRSLHIYPELWKP
ncbi:hypothetical protein A1O7_02128, partial [Cladophialophora yegresii CBS 114405]